MSRKLRERDFDVGEQSFMLRFLHEGMVVMDVGAHQGLYTLLASKKVGSKGKVIAFEPSPREFGRLKFNLMLNRCRNVRVENKAISSTTGTGELFICQGRETGCNSLRPPAVSEPTKPVRVSLTTLDEYSQDEGIGRVDFLKLDVEGAELDVLKGATQVLNNRPRPIIMCELADIRTEPWGYHSIEIYRFLAGRGYHWYSVTREGQLHPCQEKKAFHENLLAVPEEKEILVT
jgi:FkbM family methyltransferase